MISAKISMCLGFIRSLLNVSVAYTNGHTETEKCVELVDFTDL
jgi:hypothetical protein